MTDILSEAEEVAARAWSQWGLGATLTLDCLRAAMQFLRDESNKHLIPGEERLDLGDWLDNRGHYNDAAAYLLRDLEDDATY